MSHYFNDYGEQQALPTIIVHNTTNWIKVSYRNDQGEVFRVGIHQKPNPIGFRAKVKG